MSLLLALVEQSDELPITRMDRHGRRQVVRHLRTVREVCENRLSLQRLAAQRAGDADAVEHLADLGLEAEQFQERRIEVRALDDRVVAAGRLGDLRPTHDTRHAHASFIHCRFAAAQRRVAGGRGAVHRVVHVPAVVRKEHDGGAIGDAKPVHRVEQFADRIVHGLDHGRVGRAALRIVGIDAGTVFLDQGLLGIEWRMDRELPVVEKERAVLVLLHERHRLIAHAVLNVLGRRTFPEILELPWCYETTGRAGTGMMWNVHVKSLLQR